MSLQSPLDPSGSASASGSGSMGRLHPDSQSTRTAASDEADNDNENGPIYFPTRMSAEKSRQSQDGLHSSMDKPGYSDNAAAAAESDQLYQPDEAFAFRLRRRASDGESLAGSYWRMAAEASNTISTRALERSDGMSAKERKRAYWRAAIVNVTLIAGWCEFSVLSPRLKVAEWAACSPTFARDRPVLNLDIDIQQVDVLSGQIQLFFSPLCHLLPHGHAVCSGNRCKNLVRGQARSAQTQRRTC